jgi:hypothetical protein
MAMLCGEISTNFDPVIPQIQKTAKQSGVTYAML